MRGKTEPMPLCARVVADRGLRSRYQRISKWRAGLERELETLRADSHAAEARGATDEAALLRGMLTELGGPFTGSHQHESED